MFDKIEESEKSLCDDVNETDLTQEIIEGPPAAGCKEDNERWKIDTRYSILGSLDVHNFHFRFCMCGKLGPITRRNWTYFCGR